MDRRVFVIEAGKAFPVVAGALYLIGCGGSSTSPSAVADVQSESTTVNSHTHTENVPASDQLHLESFQAGNVSGSAVVVRTSPDYVADRHAGRREIEVAGGRKIAAPSDTDTARGT